MSSNGTRWLGLALASLLFVGCGGGGGNSPTEPPAVTSRVIHSHLRSSSATTFTAAFELDGRQIIASQSSTVAGSTSVINADLEALGLSRGAHQIRVRFLEVRPSASVFLYTASISENGRTVVPDVPDAVATVATGGTMDLTITF